jgi:hypothetical protein
VTLRHPDLVGAAAIALVAAAVIGGALTSPDPGFGVVRPATFPVVLGALMLLSAAWLAFDTLRAGSALDLEPLDRGPLLRSAIASAVFLLAFVPLGFVLTAAPYLVIQSRILGSRSLFRDAVGCLAFVLAIYFLFVRFLTVDLPNGPLPF